MEYENRYLREQIVLPEFVHEYAAMDTVDKMHTESAQNKVKYDLSVSYRGELEAMSPIILNGDVSKILK